MDIITETPALRILKRFADGAKLLVEEKPYNPNSFPYTFKLNHQSYSGSIHVIRNIKNLSRETLLDPEFVPLFFIHYEYTAPKKGGWFTSYTPEKFELKTIEAIRVGHPNSNWYCDNRISKEDKLIINDILTSLFYSVKELNDIRNAIEWDNAVV